MAEFQNQGYDPFKAKQEAVRNLQKQEKERQATEKTSAVRSGATGVNATTTGLENVAGRAQEEAKFTGAKEFTFAQPKVGFAEGTAEKPEKSAEQLRQEALAALTLDDQADPIKVQKAINDADKAHLEAVKLLGEKQTKDVEDATTKATEDVTGQVKSYKEFMDRVRKSSLYTGQVGQMGQVQQQDMALAEAMANPNIPVGDIGLMASSVSDYDSRMSSLYSAVLGGQMEQARADALRAMTGMNLAGQKLDTAVEGYTDAAGKADERLTTAETGAFNSIDTAKAEALKKVAQPQEPEAFNVQEFSNAKAKERSDSAAAQVGYKETSMLIGDVEHDMKINWTGRYDQFRDILARIDKNKITPSERAKINSLYNELASIYRQQKIDESIKAFRAKLNSRPLGYIDISR